MTYQVGIHLHPQDDDEIEHTLKTFFEVIAETHVIREQEVRETKSLDPAIGIFISIVGAWATERYLLNPFADRIELWIKALWTVWSKKTPRRRFNIAIKFEEDNFHVHILNTADPDVLSKIGEFVEKAREAHVIGKKQGFTLDQVRFLPDGSNDMLVVGYQQNRPSYIVDLTTSSVRPIQNSMISINEVEGKLFQLMTLIRRQDYLAMLAETGQVGSSDQPTKTDNVIEEIKKDLRGSVNE